MQHECIPQALLGMDIICQAKSGMGKTAVFVLSTLHLLEPKDEECPSGASRGFHFTSTVYTDVHAFHFCPFLCIDSTAAEGAKHLVRTH